MTSPQRSYLSGLNISQRLQRVCPAVRPGTGKNVRASRITYGRLIESVLSEWIVPSLMR
jgi:hypothetical protein